MRRTLIGILTALALIIGWQASSADATTSQTIAPGQVIFVQYGNCSGYISIANFGHALAQFEEQSGSHCHPRTQVAVVSYYNGQIKDENFWVPCSLYGRLYNPYPTGCIYDWAKTTSVGGGSVVGAYLMLCYDPYYPAPVDPNRFACVEKRYSIWG